MERWVEDLRKRVPFRSQNLADTEKNIIVALAETAYSLVQVSETLEEQTSAMEDKASGSLVQVSETTPINFGVRDHGGGKHPWGDDDPENLISPSKLADRLGIPSDDRKVREALRKRLEAWRNANRDGGWIEVADRKPRQPGYLYPVGKVWPVIEDMKVSG